MEFSFESSFNRVEVLAKLMPLPSVSMTLPCVSLKAKISKDTTCGACELEEELDDEDETLEELEELELDELLLEDELLELLEELLELLEVVLEEVDEEITLLVVENGGSEQQSDTLTFVEVDVEVDVEPLVFEVSLVEACGVHAVAQIANSMMAPNNKLFFFIKNLSQLLNNKITIFSMVNLLFCFDYDTLFLTSAAIVTSLDIVFAFILVH